MKVSETNELPSDVEARIMAPVQELAKGAWQEILPRWGFAGVQILVSSQCAPCGPSGKA